jgi:[ribosomal protein S5]-alanine N-acetyltransferase
VSWITPRLSIRRFRETDWRDLHELQGDPQATEFIGGAWSQEKTRQVTNAIVASYESKDLEWFAVADRATDIVFGVCWLGTLNAKWCDALGIPLQEIQLGYRYARRHWGHGYATEAGRAMLARGFDQLKLPRIVAIVDVRNCSSERVLQKLGMKYTRDAALDGVAIRQYSIEAKDFPIAHVCP